MQTFNSVACRLCHFGIRRNCERQQLADHLNRLQERRMPMKTKRNLLNYKLFKEAENLVS